MSNPILDAVRAKLDDGTGVYNPVQFLEALAKEQEGSEMTSPVMDFIAPHLTNDELDALARDVPEVRKDAYAAICYSVTGDGRRWFAAIDPEAPVWLRRGDLYITDARSRHMPGDRTVLRYTAITCGCLWLAD